MNSISPAQTGAAGAVTAAVVSVIAAVIKHYHIDLDGDAQVSIAVGIVAGAHWLAQTLIARASAKAVISAQ
ncbi:hypothetical protein [Trinickia dinghuensis]|uniref:Holin n=1 Tax=Trinickia dinghuensis TaxID=2291023 RepID=A0A3D8K2Z8_9BURK|nr:hypothetical protein [Trinickia dinghuensis]RDU99245.1 hypothetical protein DWV00_08985 [Trinickia dinghuensis]